MSDAGAENQKQNQILNLNPPPAYNYVNSQLVPTCLMGWGYVFFGREKWSLNLREKANNFEIPGGFQISKFKLHLYAFGKICYLLFIPYIFLRFVSPSGCGGSNRQHNNNKFLCSCRYKFACQKRRGKVSFTSFFFDVSHTKSKVSNGRQVGDRFSFKTPTQCVFVQMLMSLSALQHFYMCPV